MYEHYLTAFKNGVIDIDIKIDKDEMWNDTDPRTPRMETPNGVEVTVTFAVHTDSEAWMTIDGDGIVHTAFGGTGTSLRELNDYAEQTVRIWRGITGNNATTCRYASPKQSHRDNAPDQEIINA